MTQESIIDTSKPNAGRIYDYILGGSLNFEVDRQAAEYLIKLAPFVPKTTRLQRWCLQDIAAELTGKRGFDIILDLASGLPTNDHIHAVVPPDTKVIYSDYDPIVVQYAEDILKDTPNTICLQSDARRVMDLLQHPRVEEILQGRRDVAFVSWGIAAFLSDEDIAYIARTLYDWSAPNSVWAFNAQLANINPDHPLAAKGMGVYKQMGTPLQIRTTEQYKALIKPWRLESDFIPLAEWQNFDISTMTEEDLAVFGTSAGGYGAYLVK